jgi:CBS domain-containing protein
MTIEGICRREIVFASLKDSVATAARLMREHDVGSLVITDDEDAKHIPVGIITDRDIAVAVVALGLDAETLACGDAMGDEFVSVPETASIAETIHLMRHKGVRRLALLDASGALVALISADDMLLLSEEDSRAASMVLRPEVRAKAIEIAMALLREEHDEDFAVRTGIARAQEWANGRAGLRSPHDRF